MPLLILLAVLHNPFPAIRAWAGHRVNAIANFYVNHIQRHPMPRVVDISKGYK